VRVHKPVLPRRVRMVTLLAASAGVLACTALASPGIASASTSPSQQAYPAYAAVMTGGASVTTDQVQSDALPPNFTVIPGQALNVEGGLTNSTDTAQTVTAQFQIECYTAAYQSVDVYGPSIAVTIPGDPSIVPGVDVMQKVEGTITVPSSCAHDAALPDDGFVAFNVSQYGMSAAQDTFLTIGSTLPGPGLPAVGAAGVVTLYRAVDSTELSAIEANGNRYSLPAGGPEGKYFYPTQAQAESLASLYESQGYGTYTITSATVDESALATSADSISIAGEGDAYFLLEEGVAAMSEVTVLP
jgi:hypothetical protein